jgi:YidC/Oxa1 family membrane protein insertase
MDKKNTIIGITLLLAAFGLMVYGPKSQRATPPPPPQPAPSGQAAGTPAPNPGVEAGSPPSQVIAPTPTPAPAAAATPAEGQPVALQSQLLPNPPPLFAPLAPKRADEQITTIGNEFIEARFTNYGGAIAEVALKKHRAHKTGPEEPLVLNSERHAPILTLARLPGADDGAAYERVSATGNQVVFRAVVGGQLEVLRTYTVSTDEKTQDPYVIRNETLLRNVGAAPITGGQLALNIGTARLVHDTDDGEYLLSGRFDGDDLNLTRRSSLQESGGFLGMFGRHGAYAYQRDLGPTVWGTVENQFFVTIVTPKKPGAGVLVRRVELPHRAESARPRHGLTSDMYVDSATIAAGGSETLSFDVYAGPKEFIRLERFGQRQDEVMQWGWFEFFSGILLWLMTNVQQLVSGSEWSWGWAIILTTVVVRTALWPLTGMSTRAAKRMAKISGPLKELQEKYKDNRQKLTEETMKLWKEHKVNPAAGCLPILVQMPIFIGLFYMLRSAAELRFAEFLWIKDLSAPDTVAYVFGIPINPMPVLMGVSSMIQMRLTPTPTTDNPSAKIMKFMPILFTVMCYTFSSGLSVYWTCTNLFSIFQQFVTNRRKDPVEIAPTKPGAAERAKPVRDAKVTNVPGGKKKK